MIRNIRAWCEVLIHCQLLCLDWADSHYATDICKIISTEGYAFKEIIKFYILHSLKPKKQSILRDLFKVRGANACLCVLSFGNEKP